MADGLDKVVTVKNGKYSLTGPKIYLWSKPQSREAEKPCPTGQKNKWVCPNVMAVRKMVKTKAEVTAMKTKAEGNKKTAEDNIKNGTGDKKKQNAALKKYTGRIAYIKKILKVYPIPKKDDELLPWLRNRKIVVKHKDLGKVTEKLIQTKDAQPYQFKF